ncbi:MAG TPA: nucleoside triphosphate pyrophosphatase [Streptosporangiaceae bacterium]|nr:nucleoside triphosphate pyrophosphatase [Streptosporangiaceae bacterium]
MTSPTPPALVLASGSPTRLRVLRDAGIDPEVVVSGVDETADETSDTASVAQELADRKARAVAALRPDALVLGCDSLLDLDGTAFGKPGSPAEVAAMWRRLSGEVATLWTGHCLIDGTAGRHARGTAGTIVRFGVPNDDELAAYAASGEPLALAGAFSIEGLGAPFIQGIEGDPSNVLGLSLPLLRRLLADLGLAITDLWRPGTLPVVPG